MEVPDFTTVPILDHHAHPLVRAEKALDGATFRRFFTESDEIAIRDRHVPHTVFYRRALRDLAAFWGCEPEEDGVLACRSALPLPDLVARLFTDARIAAVLVDYGLPRADTYSHADLQPLMPCPVAPILRLETLAQGLILQEASFDGMVDAFVAHVERARADGVVALKSIIAYRTGLAIQETSRREAATAFGPVRAKAEREGGLRLASKPLCDYLVLRALEIAERQELPVQFHTGFGDADLDLLLANPLHLRPLLQSGRYRRVPFVLLHAGYPYVRETAYLAGLYANVFMDLSLAVPFVAAEIPALLTQALGLAPASKLLYASDAAGLPETFWLAAHWLRRDLARVLSEMVSEGVLCQADALEIAERILWRNASELYGISIKGVYS